MTSDIQLQLKKVTGWSIALGILMVIAGAFTITLPLATGLAVTLWLGWVYTFVGIHSGVLKHYGSRSAFI